MSTTVWKKGKLVPVKEKGFTLEEKAEAVLYSLGESIDSFNYASALDQLLTNEGDPKYIVLGSVLYEVGEIEEILFDDIFKAKKNSDGYIEYEVRFNDECCDIAEAIECSVKEGME